MSDNNVAQPDSNVETIYDLYHSPYSICSLMVRLTIALGAKSDPSNSRIFFAHDIDISNEDQLTEGYLKINPKGQIPALDSPILPSPLTDSVDITSYLCTLYPSLAPTQHREKIFQLIQQLHRIQYLSLSVREGDPRTKKVATMIGPGIERRLKQKKLSDAYRAALEIKAAYHEDTLAHAIEPHAVSKAEQQTAEFFADISKLCAGNSPYIFGAQPTALDAHTIVFIARLFDVERRDLIPEEWQAYGERHTLDNPWQTVANGKATFPGIKSFWLQK